MKNTKLESFIKDIPLQLERLKKFLLDHGVTIGEFQYSFDEIDSIEVLLKNNYNKDANILDALRVYLGEALIHWCGGEWTYYKGRSPSLASYFKKFGITKIQAGRHNGYLPDYLPDSTIEYKILSDQIPESISKIIDIKCRMAKKGIISKRTL